MIMKQLIIYLSVSVILFSCKKEPAEIIEQNEITWNDTQKVRILKVEQTKSPNSFPFDTDDLMTVEYVYADDVLKEIIVQRSGEVYSYPRVASEEDKYEFDLTRDIKYGGIFVWQFSLLNISSGKINSSQKKFTHGIGLIGKRLKDANYSYGSTGLLSSIKGTGIKGEEDDSLITIPKGIELNTENYENGLLKAYSLKNYIQAYDPLLEQVLGQDFKVQAAYQSSTDVPDGLIRLVNQAILGLSYTGFEDHMYHAQYDLRVGYGLISESGEEAHAIAVAKYRYTFADWIISFGLNNAYAIPNQGNQLIASKYIKGRKLIDGEYEYDPDNYTDRLINAVYSDVDSTAYYPYTHHVESKILEIAGLKIYYELVD